ncbi:MAG: Holliday junction resolvase RuvX [Verrucomicrobiota bacterium]|nr:Holliday junction resolvase RuvX [Verrucomicrobiota bacterium]
MARIAAIDYGLKRIGLAISDARGVIAFPLDTVAGGPAAIEHIKKGFGEKLAEIEEIVVGFPLLMSGKEGEMTLLVKKFAEELEKALHIPVRLLDERLSSKLAEQSLRELDLSRKERSRKVDTTAAVMLLQTYLDQKSFRKP